MQSPEEFSRSLRKIQSGIVVNKSEVFSDEVVVQTTSFLSANHMLTASGRENIADFLSNPPGDDFFVAHTQFDTFENWLQAAKNAAGKAKIQRQFRRD